MGNIKYRILNKIAKIMNINIITEDGKNEESFMEWYGRTIKETKKPTSDVTYFTCLKMMSETIGKMPWKMYQKTDRGTMEIKDRKNKIIKLLSRRPNPFMTPTIFWSTVEMNRNHYGNAYVYVRHKFKRKKFGGEYEPIDMWIMPSDRVQIIVDDAGIFENKGRIWYSYVDEYSGQQYIFRTEDVLHFKTSHTFNGILGMPVQYILKTTVEGSVESQEFLNKLYKNGLTTKAMLEYTGSLDQKAAEKLRSGFEKLAAGAENAGRILPVPMGMKIVPLDIKLSDAQFVELKKYSALQIAAAFGIKPNQINDYEKSSYNNSEMQQLTFYTDTVLFPMKQYEEETTYKLLTEEEADDGMYLKMNEKVLLRTDSKTQMEILKDGINNGIETINEARRKLDLMDKEGGDELIVNGTYVPLRRVGAAYEKNNQDAQSETDNDKPEHMEGDNPESEEGTRKNDSNNPEKDTAETNEPEEGQKGGNNDGKDNIHQEEKDKN